MTSYLVRTDGWMGSSMDGWLDGWGQELTVYFGFWQMSLPTRCVSWFTTWLERKIQLGGQTKLLQEPKIYKVSLLVKKLLVTPFLILWQKVSGTQPVSPTWPLETPGLCDLTRGCFSEQGSHPLEGQDLKCCTQIQLDKINDSTRF